MHFDTRGLRTTVRGLVKQPVFASTVILSLALAIGLNTTMYSVLDALIHPHVAMRDPDRLYVVRYWGDYHNRVNNITRDEMLRSDLPHADGITYIERGGELNFVHDSAFARGGLASVGANYFDVLGVHPMMGRTFTSADAAANSKAIVLSARIVPTLFPHGESPIGRDVIIGHAAYVVIGVLPDDADFPLETTVGWAIGPVQRTGTYVRIIRLRPNATRGAMQSDLAVIAARIATMAGESPKRNGFRDDPAYNVNVQFHYEGFHIAIIGAVLAVLLVACANLANIQLARGMGRRRELALRAALGADRARLMRHVLAESVLLAIIGLVLGLVCTFWMTRGARTSIPPIVGAFVADPRLDWRVLLFSVFATVGCVVLVGLLPAIQISRVDPNELLKSGAGTGAHKRHRRQYGILVAAEMALALGVMAAAGLMARAALAVAATAYDVGYDARPLVSAGAWLNAGTAGAVRAPDVLRAMANRIRVLPGVTDAAAYTYGQTLHHTVTLSDAGGVREFKTQILGYQVVSPSYFRVMRQPIVQGRDFEEGEQDLGAVILDDVMARRLFPHGDAVGHDIKLGSFASNAAWVPVVGVVATIRDGEHLALNPGDTTMLGGRIVYLPGLRDSVTTWTWSDPSRLRDRRRVLDINAVVRAASDPARVTIAVGRALASDPALVASSAEPMVQRLGIESNIASHDFIAELFVAFAVIGVVLAAFGVYGVVAQSVVERRREFGVRIALGALPRDILRVVLRESAVIALTGVAAGLVLTKYGVQLLRWQAIDGDVYNAPLFAGAALVLAAVVTVAALVPAMRATRVDPTESLRNTD